MHNNTINPTPKPLRGFGSLRALRSGAGIVGVMRPNTEIGLP